MKLVYFGTAPFAVPALKAVAKDVCLVVSQPDRPSGRGMKLAPSPVKLVAMELGIPVETPEKARDPEFVERIRNLDADALLVAAYGQILSKKLLGAARRGGVNLHGSLLPKYRGAAPIQRCIQNGDVETGVCLMQMDVGMDTGDVIDVQRTLIGPDETYGELAQRLADIAAEQAREWMPAIAQGGYTGTPQDPQLATHAAKVEKAEAELFPGEAVEVAYNRYRAFTPSPGPFVRTKYGLLRLSVARKSARTGEVGTLVSTENGFGIAFVGGSIEVWELQPEGKRRMPFRDFVNGLRIKPGESLF